MTRSPGLVPALSALGLVGLLALLAVALAAPLGPEEGFMDGFMEGFMDGFEVDPEMGSVEIRDVGASSRVQPARLATDVEVRVDVQAANARDVHMVIVIAAQPCPPVGTTGEPGFMLERREYHHQGVRNGTWTETVRTSVPLSQGMPASVYVRVEAENAVGPAFGECVDLVPQAGRTLPA